MPSLAPNRASGLAQTTASGPASGLDATLRGLNAATAIARFYADPLACGRWMSRNFGGAVGVASPLSGRAAPPKAFFLSGPDRAKDLFERWDDLRPTGLWPVKAPKRATHERLRFNFLVLSGTRHANFARQLAAPFSRTTVEAELARQREIIRGELTLLPTTRPLDLLEATRRLATVCVFDAMFGERDPDRTMRVGDLLHRYHALNWSRAAMLLRVPAPGTPYAQVLRTAEEVEAKVGAWLDEGARLGAPNDIRALLAGLRDADGAPVSREFAVANLCTLAWAGFDTPWLGLFWTLTLLARHRAVLEDLRAELKARGAFENPSVETLARIPLLNGVIYEALRLRPPAPFIGLRAVRDTEIGDVSAPSGAAIFLSAYETHRDPDVYPDPEAYRPERWADGKAPNAFTFLAFSGGVRRCPGYSYSMLFLRLALTEILARRTLMLCDDAPIPVRAAPTLTPTRPVLAQLGRRRAPTPRRAPERARALTA